MALMTIGEYQKTHFSEGSCPSERTVRNWIRKRVIYGKKIGGKYFVDPMVDVVTPVNGFVLRVLKAGQEDEKDS